MKSTAAVVVLLFLWCAQVFAGDAPRPNVLFLAVDDLNLWVGHLGCGLVTATSLYLHNFAPDRFPVGNPETGYLDCDAGATKTFLLDAHRKNPADKFWQLPFGKRGTKERYGLTRDRDCLDNLADSTASEPPRAALKLRLFYEWKAQGEARLFGQGAAFDRYDHAHKPVQ